MADEKEKKAADEAAEGKEPKAAKKPAAKAPKEKAEGKEAKAKAAPKKAEGKETKAKSAPKKAEGKEKKAPGKQAGDAEAPKTPTARRTKAKLAGEADDTAAKETGVDKKAAEGVKDQPDAPKAATAKKEPAPAARARDTREAPQAVVVRAQARYVRSSARKARLVCDQIRGKTVPEARALLAFSPRGVAEAWTKLLESAVANAENNHELVGDELRVVAVYADEGPTIKRFRPRAMGRATRIRKRTSHLTIQLAPLSVPTAGRKGGKN